MAADPKTQELQTQHDLQVQINKVLESRSAILAAQQKALSSQVQMAVDMCKALKCEDLDKVEESLKRTRDALAAAEVESRRLNGSLTNTGQGGSNSIRTATTASSELGTSMKTSTAATIGFGAGVMQFGGIFLQTFKNVISMAGGLLETLGKLGFSIITLPFKLLGNLMDLAQSSGGGGPSPTALALEKIRVELGGLNTAVGKSAASSLPQFRAQLRDMAQTGLSVRKVFGQGREGLAKAMEMTLELFKALGPAASSFAGILKKNAVEFAMYRKGLGITAESQAQILKHAEAAGKNPKAAMHEFATMAINMGDMFDESAAAIGKDMAEMKADFANFGTLSVRELAQTAVYARKLGIAIKDLQGLIGAFDDFETAAQNAAKLSQAFNMNVDAMKMMNAQNAAERLSLLQKAFKETGKSVDAMSRQELKLLAAQSGLTEETAKIAFSQRNLSMSYEDVQKAGAKAEKKQLTQAEAMSKLADSIERVFGSGSGNKFKGFFDAFSRGFQSGILRSKEVRRLFRDIRRSLTTMFRTGKAVGKMFVDMFPGVMTTIKGLRELFNPKKWGVMATKIKDLFKTFFKDIQSDPKAGTERFIKNMKELFKSFFGQKGAAVSTIIEGGKTFLKTLGAIFMAIAPMILEGLVKSINAIADFLEAPPAIPAAVTELGKKLLDSLVQVFDLLVDRLWPPLKRMLGALWERVGPYIEDALSYVFMISLGKALLQGAVGAFGGVAVKVVADLFLRAVMPQLAATTTAAGGTQAAGAVATTATAWLPSISQFLVGIGAVLLVFAGVVLIYKVANLTPMDAIGLGIIVTALAAATLMISASLKLVPPNIGTDAAALGAVLLIMLAAGAITVAVMVMLSTIPKLDIGQILGFTAVTLTLVLASLPLILAASIIGRMGEAIAGEALKGMVIIGAFMLGLGLLGAAISVLLSAFDNPQGIAALMEGISSIMWATIGMLPAATALGLLAAAPPLGPVGLLLVLAGFAALAGLATAMVTSLLPAIMLLADVKIADPASFSATIKALVDIMHAVNEFMKGSAQLSEMMRPSLSQIFEPNAFENNVKAMKDLIYTVLNSGVVEIINALIGFAQSGNINEKAGAAISAMAAVLAASAQLMQAFTPDGEVFKTIAEEADPSFLETLALGPLAFLQANYRTGVLLDAMKAFQQQSLDNLILLLPAISGMIASLVASLGTLPPGIEKVGPFVEAFSKILGAVASIMKAMSPSDGAMKAVQDAATTWGGEEEELMQGAYDGAKKITDQMVPFLTNIKQPLVDLMKGIMDSLGPILMAATFVDEKVMSSVANVLSSMMTAVNSIMDMFKSMMDTAATRSNEYEDVFVKERKFGEILTKMTDSFASMGPIMLSLIEPMALMVRAIIAIATGIKDTRGLKTKIEAVTAALAAVGQMSQIFGPDGPFRGAPPPGSTVPVDLIAGMVHVMGQVATQILLGGENSPLQKVISAFSAVKVDNPKLLKSKAEALTSVFTGIQALSESMKTLSNMSPAGSMGLGSLADNFNRSITSGGGVEGIRGALSSMTSILSVVPKTVENAAGRVQALTQAYTALQTAFSTPLDGHNIAAIVDLGNSLEGQRNLTVKHESLPPINLSVTVHVDAEAVGVGILNNERDIKTMSGKRFNVTGPTSG